MQSYLLLVAALLSAVFFSFGEARVAPLRGLQTEQSVEETADEAHDETSDEGTATDAEVTSRARGVLSALHQPDQSCPSEIDRSERLREIENDLDSLVQEDYLEDNFSLGDKLDEIREVVATLRVWRLQTPDIAAKIRTAVGDDETAEESTVDQTAVTDTAQNMCLYDRILIEIQTKLRSWLPSLALFSATREPGSYALAVLVRYDQIWRKANELQGPFQFGRHLLQKFVGHDSDLKIHELQNWRSFGQNWVRTHVAYEAALQERYRSHGGYRNAMRNRRVHERKTRDPLRRERLEQRLSELRQEQQRTDEIMARAEALYREAEMRRRNGEPEPELTEEDLEFYRETARMRTTAHRLSEYRREDEPRHFEEIMKDIEHVMNEMMGPGFSHHHATGVYEQAITAFENAFSSVLNSDKIGRDLLQTCGDVSDGQTWKDLKSQGCLDSLFSRVITYQTDGGTLYADFESATRGFVAAYESMVESWNQLKPRLKAVKMLLEASEDGQM